jgi:hypothetical protein
LRRSFFSRSVSFLTTRLRVAVAAAVGVAVEVEEAFITRVILPPLYLRHEPGSILVAYRDEECTQKYCTWQSWMPKPGSGTRIIHSQDGGRFRVVWLDATLCAAFVWEIGE